MTRLGSLRIKTPLNRRPKRRTSFVDFNADQGPLRSTGDPRLDLARAINRGPASR